jgi:hypothetical protein
MSYYCGVSPYYPYPLYPAYQYSVAPYAYTFPYYVFPSEYVYTLPSLPVVYPAVPWFQRGEYRVGNCMMVC